MNRRPPSLRLELFIAVLSACLCGAGAFARAGPAARPLREVVVSYADESGKLQLYRVNEDGSGRRRITDGARDCSMPAWSPDGKKLVYVRQGGGGNELWLSSPDGEDARMLLGSGMNLVPSWLPDSKHIVWMTLTPEDESFGAGLLRVVWMVSGLGKRPAEIGRLRIMDTETGQSRPLFGGPEQPKVSDLMPAVSPDGTKVAFVSNRGGRFRIWLSDLDGGAAVPVSPVSAETDERLGLPIEQKVPSWSPDGRWLAHWEGVEMDHMSPYTGKADPRRDALIEGTWNVWIVGRDGKGKRMAGHGDDPSWSPDGFVTRAFPDKARGGANVMVQTEEGWRELPIVPPKTARFGRFTWKPL